MEGASQKRTGIDLFDGQASFCVERGARGFNISFCKRRNVSASFLLLAKLIPLLYPEEMSSPLSFNLPED
jgi:hypothetical protein